LTHPHHAWQNFCVGLSGASFCRREACVRKTAIDAQRLLDVSARLGDAVVDPSAWPELMENICAAVGATGAMLLQSDLRTTDIPRTESLTDLCKDYFGNNWHTRDVRANRGVPLLLKGVRVISDQDLVSLEEMRTLPFYQDHKVPMGFQWFAAVGFRAGSALWGLSIQRTIREGPFEDDDKPVLATLSDRMTEVATLSSAVGRIALSSATNALKSVHQPAVALDRLGFVLDANSEAAELFDSELHIKNRRLFVADPQAKNFLQTLLDRLRTTPDTLPLPLEPFFIRRRNKATVLIRILPVHGAARAPFLNARALLIFSSIEPKLATGPLLLARAFGLTPAEARLAALIAQGNSTEQAAEQLGIARVTARNQLRAVFAKTDTHRQSELVALLARF
jgi:DNA-binding CsgD family transcriptional regulator